MGPKDLITCSVYIASDAVPPGGQEMARIFFFGHRGLDIQQEAD
jgi:hypothetical protein